jgi:hypothetical protein
MAKKISSGPRISPKLKTLASKALRVPSKLTTKETRELGGEILRQIEPRGGKIK